MVLSPKVNVLMMTPTSLLSCFRSRVHCGGCYRHPPAVSTDLCPLIIAAPSLLLGAWGGVRCLWCSPKTQDFTHSVLVTRLTSSTQHTGMLHCSLQSRVMFCSELHVVTQPHHQCPAPPSVASPQQTWGQERGGSVQTAGGRTGYNAAITSSQPPGTLDSRQSPPPATWLQVLSDFLSPVSV